MFKLAVNVSKTFFFASEANMFDSGKPGASTINLCGRKLVLATAIYFHPNWVSEEPIIKVEFGKGIQFSRLQLCL